MSRILLIDADTSTAALLAGPLAAYGLTVQAAQTAAGGLASAQDRPPTYIVVALALPDQDGAAVLAQLRGRTRTAHIPVMAIAERAQSSRQNEILQAGADDFLIKPFDSEIAALRIRNAVTRAQRDGLHHPQTGLPTGRLVQERIRVLSEEYDWFYLDFEIEGFAPFREAYGFMTGQEVIAFAASLLAGISSDVGTPRDFIGQKSDTEFVLITTLDRGADVQKQLEQRFNDEVLTFYSFTEREQGGLDLAGEDGTTVRYPLMRAKIRTQQGEKE